MRPFAIAALTAVVAASSAPAFAQTVDELTIYGRPGGPPDTLSEAVSYADLDLTIPDDRTVLRHRVNYTARKLCRILGSDGPSVGNLGRSCEDLAIRDAMRQMRVAVAEAYDRRAYAYGYGYRAGLYAYNGP